MVDLRVRAVVLNRALLGGRGHSPGGARVGYRMGEKFQKKIIQKTNFPHVEMQVVGL